MKRVGHWSVLDFGRSCARQRRRGGWVSDCHVQTVDIASAVRTFALVGATRDYNVMMSFLRRHRALSLILGWVAVAVDPVAAFAATPVPFFRQVERIGLFCETTSTAGAEAPTAGMICRTAAAELAALFVGHSSAPPVVELARNDERFADPRTLVVTVHAHAQSAEGARTLALAVAVQRNDPHLGPPPLSLVPPEAVVQRDRVVAEDALSAPLRRLLNAAVARPLLGSR